MSTYVELKGLEGHSEASWDRRVDPQSLFNDTACVFQLFQGLDVQTLEVHTLRLLKTHTDRLVSRGRDFMNLCVAEQIHPTGFMFYTN